MSSEGKQSILPYDDTDPNASNHPHHRLFKEVLSQDGRNASEIMSSIIWDAQEPDYPSVLKHEIPELQVEYDRLYLAASTFEKVKNGPVEGVSKAELKNMDNFYGKTWLCEHSAPSSRPWWDALWLSDYSETESVRSAAGYRVRTNEQPPKADSKQSVGSSKNPTKG